METGKRIRLCRLIGKMEKQSGYCEKLGLENASRFRGKSNKKEK